MDETIIQQLQAHDPKFCGLATASSDGKPSCAIMAFAVDNTGQIIFNTDITSKKYIYTKSNPAASAAIGWDHAGYNYQIEGTVSFMEEADPGYKDMQDLYYSQNPHLGAFRDYPNHGFIILKPTWMRISDYAKQPKEVKEMTL